MLPCGRARANGAFPDAMKILVPPDRPHQIAVATNFGLLLSDDDGGSWRWLCEDAIGACARLYQMSAPPGDTVTTLTSAGLVVLGDGACAHDLSQASFGGVPVAMTDAFPDPVDPEHVLSLGFTSITSGVSALYESRDHGLTFATVLYQAPAGVVLTGVENAAAAPQTVYLTAVAGSAPMILASNNGGNAFSSHDQSATLGAASLALAAVDRDDPNKLYLRASDAAAQVDSLAISEDGGVSTARTLSFPPQYQMTALIKTAGGTLLATALRAYPVVACGAADLTSPDPVAAYLSTDGGHHFEPWSGAPHVRALAERAGVLYAAANSVVDGYALATSTDLGAHWTPILRFSQIAGPLACVATDCAAAWGLLEKMFGIAETPPDAGAAPTPAEHGCGCSVGGADQARAPIGLLLVLLGLRTRARRQRRVARAE
jgi:MYXO-CTERM domain-containing protein